MGEVYHPRSAAKRAAITTTMWAVVMASLVLHVLIILPALDFDSIKVIKNSAASASRTRSRRTIPVTTKTPIWIMIHDISLGASPSCSRSKCFFRSKTNPETYGYLIARNQFQPNIFHNMNQSYWEFSTTTRLEHFHLEPPSILWPPPSHNERQNETTPTGKKKKKKSHRNPSDLELWSRIETLNELVQNKTVQDVPYFGTGGRSTTRATTAAFAASASSHQNYEIIIQRVRRAPEKHLIVHCHEFRHYTLQTPDDQIEEFFSALDPKAVRLRSQLEALLQDLRMEPRLWRDFQFLVDTHGTIYHIDLDRVYQTSNRVWYQQVTMVATMTVAPSLNGCWNFVQEISAKLTRAAVEVDTKGDAVAATATATANFANHQTRVT